MTGPVEPEFDPRVPVFGQPVGDLCGVCPHCGKTDGYINIGDVHWFYCATHKTCWIGGSAKFDGWPVEDLAEQERVYDQMGFDGYDHLVDRNTMWVPLATGGRLVFSVPGRMLALGSEEPGHA